VDLAVTRGSGFSLVLLSPDEAKAEELEGILNELMDMGQEMILAEIAKETESEDPVEKAGAEYAQRIMRRMFDMFRPQRTGRALRVAQEGGANTQVATIGILVALLLPAVQAAREAARRAQSSNNMKRIVLAMHNYHDAHKTFPPRASFDEDGKPLLSWRVHILPFIDQQELYKQFRLNEPWDSEHNKSLIDLMPPIYRNPSGVPSPNEASYLVPVGPGSIFEGRDGTSLAKISDGSSNTILVLEVNDDAAVVWTRPDDLEYDADDPLAGLGTAHPGGFNAAFADGSVRFLVNATMDPQLFLGLLKMADGQPAGRF
jgi:prepilin-type processing-associated H-X9-DG protein